MSKVYKHGGNEIRSIIIPERDLLNDAPYPGNIKAGVYTINEFVELIRDNKHNPNAVQFLADILEE